MTIKAAYVLMGIVAVAVCVVVYLESREEYATDLHGTMSDCIAYQTSVNNPTMVDIISFFEQQARAGDWGDGTDSTALTCASFGCPHSEQDCTSTWQQRADFYYEMTAMG